MSIDEIKDTYSMREIAARYGIYPNRDGFCKCPFHDERKPSMKLYEKDFHCFSCGKHGDVIDFVRMMEDISFKEAFISLGGTYEKDPSFSTRAKVYHAQKEREKHQKTQERLKEKRALNNALISIYRRYVDNSEPLSDVWCDCYNALQYQLYLHEELNK